MPSTSEVRPLLEAIETAAERAADLTREMLAYSGKGRFQNQRLSLNDLIERTVNLLSSAISKNARMTLRLSPKLPALFGDVTQIQQVVMNLITNASDAIGEHSGVISIATRDGALGPAELEREGLGSDLEPGRHVSRWMQDTTTLRRR